MSRYAPSDYRPGRDRSRSPPRFADRRTSVASTGYGNRAADLSRGGADAPRGPRSQFDGGRPSLGSGASGPGPSRGNYSGRGEIRELRDAPPLGSDRGRSFKDREFDRRERITSPRGRSPPRNFREPRDYPPPRELDIPRARRGSRDGPPSAGSTYSDAPAPFASAPSFRGGFGRGRGRGDFEFRGGRGGRRNLDDRDLFRRDRSPPVSRWPRDTRDISREAREPERRDERRFDRRDDERRPEWTERERDVDRVRREPPQPRLENRASNDSLASGASHPPPAPHVNPDRLALLESAGADTSVRRPSLTPSASSAREHRRDQPEIPAYLNGRAETTNNRYGSRGSSPPTQAPPVPAFTLSFAPASQGGAQHGSKPATESRNLHHTSDTNVQDTSRPMSRDKPAPADVPNAPKSTPHVQNPQAAEAPAAAPKAPRALGNDVDTNATPSQRLHSSKSWEGGSGNDSNVVHNRNDVSGSQNGPQPAVASSPNVSNGRFPNPYQPVSPVAQRGHDISAPTGPKASRPHPAASPRMPFASPQSDNLNNPNPAFSRTRTPPPPSAPSGPRNRAFSVSPKVTTTSIPTAPKANRAPPVAPRGLDRGPAMPARAPERGNTMQPRVPPTAPRAAQWNQWRRPGAPTSAERSIPAKRDFTGEEKRRPSVATSNGEQSQEPQTAVKLETTEQPRLAEKPGTSVDADHMDVDEQAPVRKQRTSVGHSAQQSFFGKPLEKSGDDSSMSDAPEEAVSSSEDDDLEIEDPALFEAKFERQKRELDAQLIDMSSRDVSVTIPLESAVRLAQVSLEDLQNFQERDQDMDVDEPERAPQDKQPPSDESEESVLTPQADDTAAVAIQDGDSDATGSRRMRAPSPEAINLPYLLKEPASAFNDSWEFRDNLRRQDDTREAVSSALDEEVTQEQEEEEDLEATFAEYYRRWKIECENLDREKEIEERLERQQSDEPGPDLDTSPNPPPSTSTAEGRRALKFSSDYEFQQVLKQSEETARLEQEKQDIELKKVQADMEKEAVIPDQMTAKDYQRSCFIDNNRLCDPRSLIRIFTYQPPVDDFTDHEQQIFIAAYKETPKKWTEIATLLPGRAARDCIRHYYANKWDGRFKDNRRRKGGARRGRGTKGAPRGKGSAAMADLGRNEDIVQSVSDSGRPKRAAAPTTFGERETDAKLALQGQSPARRQGAAKQDGDVAPEKQIKRRKGVGEKPGRKPKAAQQPLAQIAAAPSMSPNTRFVPSVPPKEDPAMIQSLAEASLLTGFHTSNRNMHVEAAHPVYIQESYPPPMPVQEDLERKHAAPAASAKPSASSYWSVPEQSDFVKYIGHFGTDFAAIAAHMGTKTQTMIKNHYQRQIDGGNRADLEEAAQLANVRRERGEDMGPPPTPTPINKRKYDNPGPTVQRNIAPHGDAMDIDDAIPGPQPQGSKHASPPQFHVQSRFPNSAQATPVQVPRVAPSPAPTPTAAVTPLGQAVATARNMQQQQQQQREREREQQQREREQQQQQPPPMGSRMSIFGDSRPESRPGLPATSSFRVSQQGTPTSQMTQSSRTVQDAHDSDFIRNLKEEQERAIRMQGQYAQQERQERMDPFQHRAALHQPPTHHSPLTQPLGMPQERKPLVESRPASPPRGFFQSSNPPRRSMDSPAFSNLAPAPVSSLASRMSFNPSPTKREEPRSSSVFSAPPAPQQPAPASAAAEAPKRSNLLSILNNEPDEPKPAPKRMSDQAMSGGMQQRVSSPAPHPLAAPAATPSLSSISAPRREAFGQSAPPSQSQSQRGPYGQPGSGPSPSVVKQEPHAIGQGLQQPPPKQDWTTRVLGQGSEPAAHSGSTTPALERDVRPYFSHHRASALGPLNGSQRHNPSPPPHTMMSHSRTPSLSTGGPSQPPREQRGYLPNQQQGQHQVGTPSAQPLQPTSFPPPPPPFSQAPQSQAQNHAHHAHNTSIGPFGSMHQRSISRDDAMRHEQAYVAHQQAQAQREQDWRRMNDERRMDDERRMREEQRMHEERRMQEIRIGEERMMQERRMHDERERDSEGRRREAAYMAAQEERHRQQQGFGASRAVPPQQMHPSHFPGAGGFDHGQPRGMGMGGLREQSMREAQDLMQQEERMRRDAAYREQEAEHARRRHEEALYPARRTPLGMGGYGGPPPGGPPGPGRR